MSVTAELTRKSLTPSPWVGVKVTGTATSQKQSQQNTGDVQLTLGEKNSE